MPSSDIFEKMQKEKKINQQKWYLRTQNVIAIIKVICASLLMPIYAFVSWFEIKFKSFILFFIIILLLYIWLKLVFLNFWDWSVRYVQILRVSYIIFLIRNFFFDQSLSAVLIVNLISINLKLLIFLVNFKSILKKKLFKIGFANSFSFSSSPLFFRREERNGKK